MGKFDTDFFYVTNQSNALIRIRKQHVVYYYRYADGSHIELTKGSIYVKESPDQIDILLGKRDVEG